MDNLSRAAPVRLILSVGCPSGIGPEIGVKAALKCKTARTLLIGDYEQLTEQAARSKQKVVKVKNISEAWSSHLSGLAVFEPVFGSTDLKLKDEDKRPGRPSLKGGQAQFLWIKEAVNLVLSGEADALVTGPVNKDLIVRSKAEGAHNFSGHTEYIQKLTSAEEVVMAFWSKGFTTSLVTTHMPLKQVPESIDVKKVENACFWLADHLKKMKPTLPQSIVVCALNPHAGEHGLLGNEEKTILKGMKRAKSRMLDAGISFDLIGPMGAESAFRLAKDGRFSGVVAMYHDQATIAMKLLAFGNSVNVSLGLPIIRTSVDHGTAYDLAGKNSADAKGMLVAMDLAAKMVKWKTETSDSHACERR